METTEENTKTTQRKPLRLWPGIILAILLLGVRYVMPAIDPDYMINAIFGGLIGSGLIILWWLFFSRAAIFERWFAILLMIIGLIGFSMLLDKSIATGGQGMMFMMFSIPITSLVFVVWAVLTNRLSTKVRRITMVATILLAFGAWTLLRNDGITGEFSLDLTWRWAKTAEEKLLVQNDDNLKNQTLDSSLLKTEVEWAGFRGTNRNGIINGVKIETDWKKTPPKELWRQPVGPGCSSFAVHGDYLFTQEQRGEYEMVTCYNLNTGEPIWRHQDSARFWDSHAGAGPRSTPTIKDGKIYTLGATGILNVLNELDGSVVWSRNAADDTEVKIPGWGYASSPLVIDSAVIVAISSQLAAYDIRSGQPLWFSTDTAESYSSPQLFTIDSIKQVVMLSYSSASSFNPYTGKIVWEIPWEGATIVQPAKINGNELIISEGNRKGMRRIAVKKENDEWKIEEKWKTNRLRPDFNDYAIHKGHIYGFEGPSLACIDLKDGKRKWKSGRYGGQLMLLADQDLLLVLSEQGELVLVKAIPEEFTEIAKIQAIKGKTWNHPVMVGNTLVVRNMEEMAAFRL